MWMDRHILISQNVSNVENVKAPVRMMQSVKRCVLVPLPAVLRQLNLMNMAELLKSSREANNIYVMTAIVLIAIAISYVPTFARTVRASVLTVKDQEFIEAARSIGCSDWRIIIKYVIPNSMAPIIVQVTLGIAGAILSIAGLSFLGLGIQPPTPEWGAMLSNARSYIRDAWHVTIIPGMGIMLTILALNLVGDGLRDALDPRLKS